MNLLFMKSNRNNLRTINDFGRQWTHWKTSQESMDHPLLSDLFADTFSVDQIQNKNIVDIGSGTGRIVEMLLFYKPKFVTGVEPSREAFNAMCGNLVITPISRE